MKIGFIGLGIMGKPMAKNLLKAGHEVWVNNRSQAPVEELVALGVHGATRRELAENAVIFQMVERETLNPTDMAGMEQGDWDLTLFTCTVGGQSRVTVRFARSEP